MLPNHTVVGVGKGLEGTSGDDLIQLLAKAFSLENLCESPESSNTEKPNQVFCCMCN